MVNLGTLDLETIGEMVAGERNTRESRLCPAGKQHQCLLRETFCAGHLDGLNTAAFRTAVGQCLREEWLSREYVAKTQRNPLTELNKVVL
jgi:hypothetical protein